MDDMNPFTRPAANRRTPWLQTWLQGHPWLRDHGAQADAYRQGFRAASGFQEAEVDLLLAFLADRNRWRHGVGVRGGQDWDGWVGLVGRTEVELLPGGRIRAVCDWMPEGTVEVTARFVPVGVNRPRREPDASLSEVAIISTVKPPFIWPGLDLSVYIAAIHLAIRRAKPNSRNRKAFFTVATRPEPGKAPNLDYYRAILAEYEALILEGHPAPAKALAESYPDIDRTTMRGHLKRARKLRDEQKGS